MVTVRHTFQSAKSDDPTALADGQVTPSRWNADHVIENLVIADVTGLQTALDSKATPSDVTAAVAALVDTAPATLDTLNELAAALGDDPNFATTMTTALAGKEPTITAGTTAQYYRGDKTFQTLNKAAVGLANVDNTSDASKPVSTATQAALDGKANTVHTHAIADVTGLQTALDGKQAAGSYAAATHTHTASQISDSTAAGRAVLTAADAAAQRTALGLGTAATQNSTAFAAATHTHAIADVTGLQTALDGKLATGGEAATVATINGRISAGTNVTLSGSGTAASPYVINTSGGATGDVVGPASATDNAIVRFDSTTGKLVQNSSVTVSDAGEITLPSVSSNSTPAAGNLNLFGRTISNRIYPAFAGPNGLSSAMQPLLARNKVGLWCPPGNSTTVPGVLGLVAPTTTGFTATARNVGVGNLFSRMRRLGFVTAATAGSVGQWRSTSQFTVGDATTGLGGFTYIVRFGISDAAAVSGARMYMGFAANITPTNVEPSTVLNGIGIGHGASDTTMRLYYGGTTAQTPINLGASFPANTQNVDVYEFAVFSPSNSPDVHWQVTRLNTGNVASGTIANTSTAIFPSNTSSVIGPWGYRTNNATALAVGIDVMSAYVETDF